MVDTVVQRLGRLDIAVNNAGLNRNAAAEDTPEADWDATFGLNTKGLFLCCQARLLTAQCAVQCALHAVLGNGKHMYDSAEQGFACW